MHCMFERKTIICQDRHGTTTRKLVDQKDAVISAGHTANDYTVYNNNVHYGRGGQESYVMAIELGSPSVRKTPA